jgi:hypothetical protein
MNSPLSELIQRLVAWLERNIMPYLVRLIVSAWAPVLLRGSREFWRRLLLAVAEERRRLAPYDLMSRRAKRVLCSWFAIVGSYVPACASCVVASGMAVFGPMLKPELTAHQRLGCVLTPFMLLPLAELWRKVARSERDFARRLPADAPAQTCRPR